MTSTPSAGISGLSHVAIAVPDIAAAARLLSERFGLEAGPIHENTAQKVRLCYVDLGNTRIELIAPIGHDAPLRKFLEKNPAGGLHHIAFSVPEIDAALAAVSGAGVRQAGATGRNVHGHPIAFLNPKDVLGALVELEES
jgi:methylmalonyl-CoA/ethylmalonyl-CoA epimerase